MDSASFFTVLGGTRGRGRCSVAGTAAADQMNIGKCRNSEGCCSVDVGRKNSKYIFVIPLVNYSIIL